MKIINFDDLQFSNYLTHDNDYQTIYYYVDKNPDVLFELILGTINEDLVREVFVRSYRCYGEKQIYFAENFLHHFKGLCVDEKKVTFRTFFISTRATFKDIHDFSDKELQKIGLNKFDYISYSGSHYIYYKDCVIRIANHWGPVSSCQWLLEEETDYAALCADLGISINQGLSKDYQIGYCRLKDFELIWDQLIKDLMIKSRLNELILDCVEQLDEKGWWDKELIEWRNRHPSPYTLDLERLAHNYEVWKKRYMPRFWPAREKRRFRKS